MSTAGSRGARMREEGLVKGMKTQERRVDRLYGSEHVKNTVGDYGLATGPLAVPALRIFLTELAAGLFFWLVRPQLNPCPDDPPSEHHMHYRWRLFSDCVCSISDIHLDAHWSLNRCLLSIPHSLALRAVSSGPLSVVGGERRGRGRLTTKPPLGTTSPLMSPTPYLCTRLN